MCGLADFFNHAKHIRFPSGAHSHNQARSSSISNLLLSSPSSLSATSMNFRFGVLAAVCLPASTMSLCSGVVSSETGLVGSSSLDVSLKVPGAKGSSTSEDRELNVLVGEYSRPLKLNWPYGPLYSLYLGTDLLVPTIFLIRLLLNLSRTY